MPAQRRPLHVGAEVAAGPVSGWIDRHARACLWTLAAVAVVLRLLLAIRSPWAFGYVWDLYHEAIQRLYATGRLPQSTDCWECWQPPLLFLLSWPLYALGRLVWPVSPWPDDYALRFAGVIPLASGFAVLYYTDRLLRLLGHRGAWRVIGFGIAAALPCLFYNTYGLEPDILLAGLLSAFLYYLTRWFVRPVSATRVDIARLAILAGLAAMTKYNGLVGIFAGTIVLAIGLLRQPTIVTARIAGSFLVIALLIGHWKYVDNLHRYGKPFFANGDAGAGFSLTERVLHNDYEFATFRLNELLALTCDDAPPGMLTDLPVYKSVWTTLHGLAWGDMGFFTNPTRHGTRYPFYKDRHIPYWLASAVLILAIAPQLLAVAGFLVTMTRRAYVPLTVIVVLGWLLYLQYLLSQQIWALKAKYLLFLVPAYAVYVASGLRWVRTRVSPAIAEAVTVLLVALIVIANAYLAAFAIG